MRFVALPKICDILRRYRSLTRCWAWKPCTSLARNLKEYTFFEYQANEALHLSEREREVFLHCLNEIQAELERGIDRLTRRLIVSNIEILLDHLLRFYERQFITREIANSDLLARFERLPVSLRMRSPK